MTRTTDDHGATAVLIALLLSGVLIGMSALVVDVGGLFGERRQLQNGADGGSLAAAAACASAAGCTAASALTTAQQFANSNSNDGTSNVDRVCGTGLGSCPANQGAWDCPALSGGALASAKYVQVQTSTRTSGGSNLIGPVLARALSGNGGYAGTTVRACSRASWGPAQSITATLPLTMSACEWYNYTSNGTVFATPPTPPFNGATVWPTERDIYFHNTTQAPHCNQGPSGADLAGGFGWLTVNSGCQLSEGAGNWYNDSTGRAGPNGCDTLLTSLVGTVIDVPVYRQTNNLTGSNGQYYIDGFAPFFITGYYVNGGDYVKSLVDNKKLCASNSASDSCIKGFFTKDLQPKSGQIGGGTNYGTVVIQMSG